MEASNPGFRPVIVNILNRWSGLKMMVDHQMGGRLSGEKAVFLIEYLHQVFTSNQSVEAEDLEDLLIEYMDGECNTILEDDSPIEVSRALVRLFGIYSSGGLEAAEAELRNLPPVADWLDVVPETPARRQETVDGSESDDEGVQEGGEDQDMDSEWTKVSYSRRK